MNIPSMEPSSTTSAIKKRRFRSGAQISANITIRARLLISFVALTVLPIALMGVVSSVLNTRSIQQRVHAQFDSVLTLKEAEIQTWLSGLGNDLIIASIDERDRASMRVLLQKEDVDASIRESSYERLRTRFEDIVQQTGRFEELFLLNPEGQVILSTDPTQEGEVLEDQALSEAKAKETLVQPPRFFPPLNRMTVVVAQPVFDLWGVRTGALAGRANLDQLTNIMLEQTGLGDTGETYLIGSDHTLLTPLRFEGFIPGETKIHSHGANASADTYLHGFGSYDNYRGTSVLGVYHWLPELQVALLAEQTEAEALSANRTLLLINSVFTLGAAGITLTAGLFVTRSIANRLANLAKTATQIADGRLEQLASVEREDEIGTLAQAFNRMTSQLRELIEGLEGRVASRTRDLERRTAYLEASAQVGHATASILEQDQLIREVVSVIREQFDLYYVGLFLCDERKEWALLRAGTGEAGKAMLARGHRIKIGEGMIGWSIANALPRVAEEAGDDTVRLATSELPLTRSEVAIPLRSHDQVLGALTVQDTRPNAFDQAAIAALQTMTDQVAVALDNARLFSEAQTALEATRRAYGELSREAWTDFLGARRDLAFRSDERGVARLEDVDAWHFDVDQKFQEHHTAQATALSESKDDNSGDRHSLVIPIKVHGQVIGTIDTYKAGKYDWSTEEVSLMQEVTDQLALALDSARLHQDTQRRAAREFLVGTVASQIRATLDIDTVLRTAVGAIYEALDLDEVTINLSPEIQDNHALDT